MVRARNRPHKRGTEAARRRVWYWSTRTCAARVNIINICDVSHGLARVHELNRALWSLICQVLELGWKGERERLTNQLCSSFASRSLQNFVFYAKGHATISVQQLRTEEAPNAPNSWRAQAAAPAAA